MPVPSAPSAAAFADIYRAHFDFVWRMARRLGIHTNSLDDVVQDVFLVVHRRFADYDPSAPIRGWLYGVTVRVVADHKRRSRRKDRPLVGTETNDYGEERFESVVPAPSTAAEQAESVALLEQLLGRLAPEKAEVLVLAHLEQLTVPEIAEGTGTNLNTVYSRLRAARREFDALVAAHSPRKEP